ncbi:hypothetical protein LK492_19455, partial [Phocaeicola vulgatus]|nr:hypothetical protein [Phocaeicola vulgatus]
LNPTSSFNPFNLLQCRPHPCRPYKPSKEMPDETPHHTYACHHRCPACLAIHDARHRFPASSGIRRRRG